MKTLWIALLFFVYLFPPIDLRAQVVEIEEAQLLWKQNLPGNYIWFPIIEEAAPEPLDGCYVVPIFGIGQRLLRDLWFVEDYDNLGLDDLIRPKARYVQIKPPSEGEIHYGFDKPSFLELVEIITLMDYILKEEDFSLIRDDLLYFINSEALIEMPSMVYKNYLFYQSKQIPNKLAGHLFIVPLPHKEDITPLRIGSNALSYIDNNNSDMRLQIFSDYTTIPRQKRSFTINEIYIK